MCGFVCYHFEDNDDYIAKYRQFDKISYRGPDKTERWTYANLHMTFHRLAIVDLTDDAMQPMWSADASVMLVCNGEIYNHLELREKYSFITHSESDCEIILHMYDKFGIRKTLQELDGVFAFVLFDLKTNKFYAARDPHGVRPAFIGWTQGEKSVCIASEIKAMSDFCEKIVHVVPGNYYVWELGGDKVPKEMVYFDKNYRYHYLSEKEALAGIRTLLTDAVNKRLMSDREIGCLLSGGLDSSLVAALVAQNFERGKVKTFSIGLPGSPDVEFAQKVADHIGSDHHTISMPQEEFLAAIRTVIYNIESYDTTSVRASVGNYLVSKYIKDNTDVKVVFNGDGADEVCMGYLYNANAPTPTEFFEENVRLLKEIFYFDVLRSDRSISSNGLEARTPFLDKAFVGFNMSIPPEMKMFGTNNLPEKYLLRKAFDNTRLLPDEILWRTKCAFSDAVSSRENSWHKIIQDHVNGLVSDKEFKKFKSTHCAPVLKESYFYRKIFEEMFGRRHVNIIPHFWMPRWSTATDPSARELNNYSES